MKEIRFSVVTVCYNASTTIAHTIQSVLCQNYDNYEYIIVDGNSTDETLVIIRKIECKNIRLISEPDKGIYDAMNKALKIASGDYLIFLGADDLLYSENVLRDVANNISDRNSVYYGNVIMTSNKRVYDGMFSRWTWGYQNICHQSIFYPKSVYKTHSYDLQYKYTADWAYNLLLIKKQIRFEFLNLIISVYNNEGGASSNNNDEKFLNNRRQLIISAVGVFPYLYGLIVKLFLKKTQ